jgi:hypothetical protein
VSTRVRKSATPPPALRDEHALVDDVDAVAHRGDRRVDRAVPAELVERDLSHRFAFVLQPLQVGGLVLTALAEDELGLVVLDVGLCELAASDLERER